MTSDVTAKEFNPSGSEKVEQIKEAANELARLITNQVPASRRRSIALTHLETASMFAVKGLFYDDDNERRDEAGTE